MSLRGRAGRPALVKRLASPAATTSPLHHGALFLAAALFAAGCGGVAPAAKGGRDAPADTDADPAAELDRAEREIASLFGPAGPPAIAPAPEPAGVAATAEPYASPPTPPATQATQPAPAEPLSGTADEQRPAADPCTVACRALASMERAAGHLCGLSGDSDPTCTSARERVKAASARVAARCACGT